MCEGAVSVCRDRGLVLFRLPRPELRHRRVGLHRLVDQVVTKDRVLYFLDLCNVDVLNGVIVFVSISGPRGALT